MDAWTVGWISLFVLLLRLLYRYLTKPYTFWKERGVPSVPGVPFFGSLIGNITKHQQDILVKRYEKYGRVYGFYESTRPALSIADPDLLRDILLKDFKSFTDRRDMTSGDRMLDKIVSGLKGEEWKRVRTIITPAFSSGKIRKMAAIMSDSAKTTAENFEKYAKEKKPVDFKNLLGAFSLDVIARSAFGTALDSHNDPDNDFVRYARAGFTSTVSMKMMLSVLCPSILKMFRIHIFASEATVFFEQLALKVIKHRRETGQVKNDFLQLLMDANDEAMKEETLTPGSHHDQQQLEQDAGKTANGVEHPQITPVKKYKSLTKEELIAQCVLFFFAAYDTTASTLAFVAHFLAINPECQEKLICEIDDTLKENKHEFTYEAVQSMKYLETVILETLRIYPPAASFDRVAAEDYKLANTNIVVPKGTIVQIPVYAIHHDPEFFEQPEKFVPERFTPEARAERNPFTYLPFGAGPRNCIGMRFAIMEVKFCLAILLSKFRFKRCPETKVPVEFYKRQGLLQPKAIMLIVEERTDKI